MELANYVGPSSDHIVWSNGFDNELGGFSPFLSSEPQVLAHFP